MFATSSNTETTLRGPYIITNVTDVGQVGSRDFTSPLEMCRIGEAAKAVIICDYLADWQISRQCLKRPT
jgi:hypothetical protein